MEQMALAGSSAAVRYPAEFMKRMVAPLARSSTLTNDFTQGNIGSQLIRFALPFMLGSLIQTLYNVVDMIILDRFVGSEAMSAVSIGGQLLIFFTNMCIGFSTGGQIMIAQYVGAGAKERLRRIIGTMFTAILLLSFILMAVELIWKRTFLEWLNTPGECFDSALDYTLVCAFGLPFIYGYNCVCAVLRGMGDSRRPFIFIAIAAVANLVLDLILIVGFHLDALGAALATVIGQALSFICSIVYLVRHRDRFGFDFKLNSFKPDSKELKLLLKLGTPLALKSNAICISVMFVNSYINAYGVAAAAVAGVGSKISNMTHIVSQSLNMAASAMIGQNIGAKLVKRVHQIIRVDLLVNLAIFAVISIFLYLFPEQLFGLFNKDPEVISWARYYIIIMIVGDLASALMGPCNALIEGGGHSTLALVIAILDGVVTRIALSLLLGITFQMGLAGFFWGNSLARYTTVIIGGIYVLSKKWENSGILAE